MKGIFLLTALSVSLQYGYGQEEQEPLQNNAFIVRVDVMKPLYWAANGGYVFEPEFSFHHKRLVYTLALGISRAEQVIYQELNYSNKGRYLQAGLQLQLFANNNSVTNGLFVGGHVGISDYEETGRVVFDGDYFGDYEARLAQDNISATFSWLASYKAVLGKHLALEAILRISQVLESFDEPEFPVYYVPGAGITNVFGDRETSHRTTGGMSLKIGYKF